MKDGQSSEGSVLLAPKKDKRFRSGYMPAGYKRPPTQPRKRKQAKDDSMDDDEE